MTRTFVLLIAEPDPDHARAVADELAAHHVQTIVCLDGADALLTVGTEQPDAVLATAHLPTIGGAGLARTLRLRTKIPVLLGVGDRDGQVAAEALAAGAAACVAHPYRPRELLPILHAIRPDRITSAEPVLAHGGLRLDPASLEVHLHGQPLRLPLRELRLLQLLMANAEGVVTRAQIRDVVWGGASGSNTITVHIQRLRQRLGDDQQNPKIILTVRGVGYRLIPPPPPAPS